MQAVEVVKGGTRTNSGSSAISTCRPRTVRGDREKLAAAAGDGRLPFHLQPAASGEPRVGWYSRRSLGRPANAKLRVGLNAGGRWPMSPASPKAIRRNCTSTIMAAVAWAVPEGRRRLCQFLGDTPALAKIPNVAVKLSGAPSYSSQPCTLTATSTNTSSRSSTPSANAVSGASMSPACRAHIANA